VQFVYNIDGTTITLEERTDVVAIAPADDGAVLAGDEQAGFWCELRDGVGTSLWRSIRRHPTLFLMEVMIDDGTGSYADVPPDGSSAVFTCVVPGDIPDAVTVALVGTDPLDDTGSPPADMLVHPLAGP
jgi:hypothetical protein